MGRPRFSGCLSADIIKKTETLARSGQKCIKFIVSVKSYLKAMLSGDTGCCYLQLFYSSIRRVLCSFSVKN